MFFLFWNSFNSLKQIFTNFETKKDELPFSVNQNNIKCLDYDMDSVVFDTNKCKNNYFESIIHILKQYTEQ